MIDVNVEQVRVVLMGWGRYFAYTGTIAVTLFGSYFYVTQDSVQQRIRYEVENSSSRSPSPQPKEYMKVLKEAAQMKENIIWKQAHDKRNKSSSVKEE